jgi:hypothetical protein
VAPVLAKCDRDGIVAYLEEDDPPRRVRITLLSFSPDNVHETGVSPGGSPDPEGCTYCDRGPDQGLPSGSVWLVGNPGTVPMIADGSLESRQR